MQFWMYSYFTLVHCSQVCALFWQQIVTVWSQLASAAWALNVTMHDPAPVVGLSPRDPLNGFAGLSAYYISSA